MLCALFVSATLAFASADATEFKDKTLQAQFEEGTLRLQYSMLGKRDWDGDELNRLYGEKRWTELVEGVVSKRYVSNLYYSISAVQRRRSGSRVLQKRTSGWRLISTRMASPASLPVAPAT